MRGGGAGAGSGSGRSRGSTGEPRTRLDDAPPPPLPRADRATGLNLPLIPAAAYLYPGQPRNGNIALSALAFRGRCVWALHGTGLGLWQPSWSHLWERRHCSLSRWPCWGISLAGHVALRWLVDVIAGQANSLRCYFGAEGSRRLRELPLRVGAVIARSGRWLWQGAGWRRLVAATSRLPGSADESRAAAWPRPGLGRAAASWAVGPKGGCWVSRRCRRRLRRRSGS